MIRSTTNGTLKSYRYNLQRSTYNLNSSRDTVLTGRNFNTFAEDPALATHSFQLRRSYTRVNSQHAVGQSVTRKYEVAWSTLDSISQDLNTTAEDSALTAIIRGTSDSTASGRSALGQELRDLVEGMVQKMNVKYGDNFVFAGADGLNVPFNMENGVLTYRGIDVSSPKPTELPTPPVVDTPAVPTPPVDPDTPIVDFAALDNIAQNEKKYADIGLGMQEDAHGNLIASSAFDAALHGVNYLGYGVDEDGDPKNVLCILDQIGQILENCDPDGNFAQEGDQETLNRLFKKFELAADNFSNKFTELDTRASFLKSNQAQLESNAYTLQEQIVGMEDADPADAITAFSWAQYCYNSALKVGNSILSESLMDYLQT